jgi:hypothetical protein
LRLREGEAGASSVTAVSPDVLDALEVASSSLVADEEEGELKVMGGGVVREEDMVWARTRQHDVETRERCASLVKRARAVWMWTDDGCDCRL